MIFATGSNFFGQLGTGSRVRESLYSPTPFGSPDEQGIDEEKVQDIQCGSQFTVVLYKNGTLQFTGSINGTVNQVLTPIEIALPVKCIQAACGRRHVLLLMDKGVVMSWGIGYFGQLGHGDDSSWDSPRIISALEPRRLGSRVTAVACGGNHSGALTESGRVFMWGLNRGGQCGQASKSDSVLEPRPIDTSQLQTGPGRGAVNIGSLVCGRNHSAALSVQGRVFVWGESGFGRLGVMDVQKFQTYPVEVPLFRAQPVRMLAAGDFHTLALTTAEGAVYSWGCGVDGATGHGTLLNVRTPRRVEFFDGLEVLAVECGANWSMAVVRGSSSGNGSLYVWGYGDGGWLGVRPPPIGTGMRRLEPDNLPASQAASLGEPAHFYCFDSRHSALTPQKVRLLGDWSVNPKGVRAGSGHMVIFCSPRDAKLSAAAAAASGSDSDTEEAAEAHVKPQRAAAGATGATTTAAVARDSQAQAKMAPGGAARSENIGADAVAVARAAEAGQHLAPSLGCLHSTHSVERSISSSTDSRHGASGAEAGVKVAAAAADPRRRLHLQQQQQQYSLPQQSKLEVSSKHDKKCMDHRSGGGPAVAPGAVGLGALSSGHGSSSNSSSAEDLQIISWSRHKKMTELTAAIEAGASVNVQDAAGNTPLIVASQNGHFHVCKLLAASGANLNAANHKGNTALHYSFNYGYEEIGKYLIDCGADEFQTNKEGLTCYEGLTQSDLDLL